MPTVTDENTGEAVEVTQVMATATIASTSAFSDLPAGAASRIEHAMAAAVRNAHADGIVDPDKIREAMMKARESERIALRNEMQGPQEQ